MSLSGTLTASGTLSGGMSRSGSVSGGVSAGQPRILVDGVLKGDGAGNISAAVSGHDYASPIIDEAEGKVAHFTDGAAGPVDDLTIDINPVQDLHGYANPWPAGGGKNLFNDADVVGYNANVNVTLSNHVLTVANSNSYQVNAFRASYGDMVFPVSDGNYTVSVSSQVGINMAIQASTDGTTFSWLASMSGSATSQTFTINGQRYIKPILYVPVNGSLTLSKFQLEKGSTATSYAPYSNICPISGRTGANVFKTGFNIFDGVTEAGGINTGTGANTTTAGYYRSANYIPCLPNTKYYFKFPVQMNILYYDANKTYTSHYTSKLNNAEVTPENAFYMRFRNGTANAWTPSSTDEICINLFDEDKDGTYEPYSGSTTSISWQTEAGTVYGGTLDVTTGLLTVTHAKVSLNGTQSMSYTAANNVNINASVWDAPMKSGTFYSDPKVMVSRVPKVNTSAALGLLVGYNNQYMYLYHANELPNVSSGATLITYLQSNPIDVTYPLATPLTYQLTPTQVTSLLGENNIWSDTGDTKVRFYADTKLYIQQLTQPTEDDMVANANIASGKYFMVGNNLYYSTASIANGAKIIVGTNCNQVTLAAALNAINS